LALADRLSPLRFSSADLRDKAEELLAAHARAYGALADPGQAALWRKRRAAASEKATGAARPSTAEQFRIATNLLDAGTQFEEGKRRLAAGNPRGALEQFQYASDIEPRAVYRAYLAWARYLVDPVRHARLAQGELFEVARTEPGCADAQFFLGEILRAQSRPAEAEEAYRRAFKADPGNRLAQELALEMMRAKKAPQR
ncbi:MAG TPA: tetratricopeptide repeat protein, partial [Anaeromyxobacteraceae bacterium]|nr:tetratricopeptide repeat protein [Anaeromyxobacteraceae bacterium]